MKLNPTCRFCGTPLKYIFADLGMCPLANSYIRPENLHKHEIFYPLHAYVCEKCFLVQIEEFEAPEKIFNEYAYFSSFSDTWLQHAKRYTDAMVSRFNLNKKSQVIEIASNDGYLLQYFKEKGIPAFGIDPAKNVAREAAKKGIPTITEFFGKTLAERLVSQGKQADLLIANNVLAHVPDLHDFIWGMQIILKPDGILTVEFPYLLELIQNSLFDTIYHEHFSYFSFNTINTIFNSYNLIIFDVEEYPTHGGSLRVYAAHEKYNKHTISSNVEKLITKENNAGMSNIQTYGLFNEKVKETKIKIIKFFIDLKGTGKKIACYGAPAKGNTLLNYCGIGKDFLDYTVDIIPYKQGLFLPGTRIPVFPPGKVNETKPDYLIILPWNFKDEIIKKMWQIKEWGGKFVTLIPEIAVF